MLMASQPISLYHCNYIIHIFLISLSTLYTWLYWLLQHHMSI